MPIWGLAGIYLAILILAYVAAIYVHLPFYAPSDWQMNDFARGMIENQNSIAEVYGREGAARFTTLRWLSLAVVPALCLLLATCFKRVYRAATRLETTVVFIVLVAASLTVMWAGHGAFFEDDALGIEPFGSRGILPRLFGGRRGPAVNGSELSFLEYWFLDVGILPLALLAIVVVTPIALKRGLIAMARDPGEG